MACTLRRLRITNFRSIREVILEDVPNFAVFAGANGAGKSNLFKALEFVGHLLALGGGLENAVSRCEPFRRQEREQGCGFEFGFWVNGVKVDYVLTIHNDGVLCMSEQIFQDGEIKYKRDKDGTIIWNGMQFPVRVSTNRSIMDSFDIRSDEILGGVFAFLRRMDVTAIDPAKIIESYKFERAPASYSRDGSRVATIIYNAENSSSDEVDKQRIAELNEWIRLLISDITVKAERSGDRNRLLFKDNSVGEWLDSSSAPDGALYVVGIVVMLLFIKESSLRLIEEPERGLHPQAISQLTWLLREKSRDRPVWVTTHSESLVRKLEDGELWLVDYVDGETMVKQATPLNSDEVTRDEAWLSNWFDGGVTW